MHKEKKMTKIPNHKLMHFLEGNVERKVTINPF